jgi:hypothetical protein
MKKTLSIILMIVILGGAMFMLTGCGEEEASSKEKSSKSESSDTNTNTGNNNSSAKKDEDTVEARLAKAGLELDDIKPDSFAEVSTYNCDDGNIKMYITNKGQLGEAVTKPMIMKIIEATADVADDGKYWASYYGLDEPRELDFSTTNWDAWMMIQMWSYQKDGQWINVVLGIVPAEEPNGENNYEYEVSLAFIY